MRKIDVFIAGAQKAGTTSLKMYLGQHPKICTHSQVEFMYFLADDIYRRGYARAYERYFSHCEDSDILLAKNVGVMTESKALQRMYEHNPNMKILIVLRNPIERAYSAYWYARRQGWETVNSFDVAVWMDPRRFNDPVAQRSVAYLERGLYIKHLREILRWFPRDNVLVFLFEDIKQKPEDVCQEIFQRLGLHPYIPDTSVRYNPAAQARWFWLNQIVNTPSRFLWFREITRWIIPDLWRDKARSLIRSINRVPFAPPPMNPGTKAKLVEYYRPYNEQLEEFIGRDLSHWNKV